MFPDHNERTAFQTRWGTFQYCVMPFGLCTAPETFQCTRNALLQEFHAFCEVYVDDIVVYSKTLAEHAKHLALVLGKLQAEKFYAKLSKCLFAAPCIDFCGFQVGAHVVATQPDKIAIIREWPEPTNVKQVRSFLWVCGFYQRFIPSHAKITAPLTDLLKKDCVWSFCGGPPGLGGPPEV